MPHQSDAEAERSPLSHRTLLITLGVFAAVIFAVSVFIVLYGWLPWLIDGRRLHQMSITNQQGALATDRDDLLKIVAGAAGVIAIVYTIRRHTLERRSVQLTQETLQVTRERDSESALLTRDAQVTDRYTKAIGQLASGNPTERLGGIYALERIMHDSERDHETIVEVLAGFVREHARPPEPDAVLSYSSPPVDVQAALTVIGRRPQRNEVHPIDLHNTWLPGINLPGARLDDVYFLGANLSYANLIEAHLEHAYLSEARLEGAHLVEANLEDASLYRAHLEKARLVETHLERANLLESNLEGANLSGAHAEVANFFRAHMEHVTLYGTHLEGANLRAAYLTGASFRAAHLDSTNLSEADLADARHLSLKQLSTAWLDDMTILPSGIQQGDISAQASRAEARQSLPKRAQ